MEAKFPVGTVVEKCTGDYHLKGIVVGTALTLAGKERFIVEHHPVATGLLHIYSENNLRKVEDAELSRVAEGYLFTRREEGGQDWDRNQIPLWGAVEV